MYILYKVDEKTVDEVYPVSNVEDKTYRGSSVGGANNQVSKLSLVRCYTFKFWGYNTERKWFLVQVKHRTALNKLLQKVEKIYFLIIIFDDMDFRKGLKKYIF